MCEIQNLLPLELAFFQISAEYSGPFPIITAVGSEAFRLDLPATVNIHPVFHASQLKPYVASALLHPVTDTTNPGPLYANNRGDEYAVESILAKRRKGRSWEYLVKWQGYSDF